MTLSNAEQPRPRASVSLEAAIVARRYYIDDRQKSEIAQELGISRFKVARLLDDARSSGIVHISIDMPAEIDIALGQRLADAFAVQRAIVVRTFDNDPSSVAAILGSAAANYLASVLTESDILGISWGSTLTATVDALPDLPAADIVQLVGGVRTGTMGAGGVELVRRLSEKTQGLAFPLHAPLLVRTAEMAGELRSDPSLAQAIDRYSQLTVALVGIGSWVPPKSSLYDEFSPAERELIIADGAVADVCTIAFDTTGSPLTSAPLTRSLGITIGELRKVPEVIAVAGGAGKAAAIAAVLRGGVVDTIVTDIATAEQMLGA